MAKKAKKTNSNKDKDKDKDKIKIEIKIGIETYLHINLIPANLLNFLVTVLAHLLQISTQNHQSKLGVFN